LHFSEAIECVIVGQMTKFLYSQCIFMPYYACSFRFINLVNCVMSHLSECNLTTDVHTSDVHPDIGSGCVTKNPVTREFCDDSDDTSDNVTKNPVCNKRKTGNKWNSKSHCKSYDNVSALSFKSEIASNLTMDDSSKTFPKPLASFESCHSVIQNFGNAALSHKWL